MARETSTAIQFEFTNSIEADRMRRFRQRRQPLHDIRPLSFGQRIVRTILSTSWPRQLSDWH